MKGEANLIGHIKNSLVNLLVNGSSCFYESLHTITITILKEWERSWIVIYCESNQSYCYKDISRQTSSTFWAVLAEASMKIKPCSFANCSPSSVLTALLWAKSHLLPISMIVMFAFACCLASSSQLAKWLKVSLLPGHNGIIVIKCRIVIKKAMQIQNVVYLVIS